MMYNANENGMIILFKIFIDYIYNLIINIAEQ